MYANKMMLSNSEIITFSGCLTRQYLLVMLKSTIANLSNTEAKSLMTEQQPVG